MLNIIVAKHGRAWGVYVDNNLVEGCFVYKRDAQARAKSIQREWDRAMEEVRVVVNIRLLLRSN